MENISLLWPELEWISDVNLRTTVRSIWEYALSASGKSIDDLFDLPFTYSIPNCTVPFILHKRLVVSIAYQTSNQLMAFLGGVVVVHLDSVVAGAILIDVGKILENLDEFKGQHHSLIGLELGKSFQLPPSIGHIIESHTKEYKGTLNSKEAIIVRFADLLSYDVLKAHDTKE